MSKWWDEDVIAKPQTNDLQEGDFRTVSINEDGHAPYRVEIYEDGAWVEAFPRLDAEGKVPNATLQTDVAILGDDGKVPTATLPDTVPILGDDGKLPDANLSASVPILQAGIIPEVNLPTTLQPIFDRQNKSVVTTQVSSSTSYQVITDLTIPILAGQLYRFEALINYTADSNVGARFSIDGPFVVQMSYTSRYSLAAGTETINHCNLFNQPAAANASSALVNGNQAVIKGIIVSFVNGDLKVVFASAGGNSIHIIQGSNFIVEKMTSWT